MRKLSVYLMNIITLLIVACSTGPTPIDYGKDGCSNCTMSIVDKRYGCELVTEKGKVYKFDAIECMIHYMNEHDKPYAQVLVTDFLSPSILIDADSGVYLRSTALPSPMGMFLTGFGDKNSALTFKGEKGGEIYSWEELNDIFNQLPAFHHN